ncbi:MAG: hypothetical protein ACREB3_11055, partial [Burkholderiales bacterium]
MKDAAVLTKDPEWLGQVRSRRDWSKWLAEGDQPEQLKVLRRHVEIERGLPCGSEGVVRKLERRAGQLLPPRPRGRPKKGDQKGKKGVRPLLF